jgi:hypothetical protein
MKPYFLKEHDATLKIKDARGLLRVGADESLRLLLPATTNSKWRNKTPEGESHKPLKNNFEVPHRPRVTGTNTYHLP